MTFTLIDERHRTEDPLDEDQTAAVKAFFAGSILKQDESAPILLEWVAEEALGIFDAMKEHGLLLRCDCTNRRAPMLSAVFPTTLRKMRHPRDEHAHGCAFENRNYTRSDSIQPDRAAPEVDKALSIHGAFRERHEPIGVHGQRVRGQARRRHTLATVLFTILERSGVNRIPHGEFATLHEQASAVRHAGEELKLAGEGDERVNLAEMLVAQPAFGSAVRGLVQLREDIVSRASNWPGDSRPQGFMVATVSGFQPIGDDGYGVSVFQWPDLQWVDAKPYVFGETDAQRGPYVGIVSYALEDRVATKPRALRCYLQPCFRNDLWFPVDSDYERQTLEKILEIRNTLPDGLTMEIHKPLFDEYVGADLLPCRPDFVLSVERNGEAVREIAIETMGYDTIDYEVAKKATHPRMEARYNGLLIKHDKVARREGSRRRLDQKFEKQLFAAIVDGVVRS